MAEHPPWSWHGAVAFTLAGAIGVGWAIGVVTATVAAGWFGHEMDAQLAGLLNGIGQVLAGALGTYLGFQVGAQGGGPAPGPGVGRRGGEGDTPPPGAGGL